MPINDQNPNTETVLFGLSKTLFWDVDISDLDAQRNALFVVERVLTRGTWYEFKRTLAFYSKQKVAQFATQIRYLDDIVLEFCVTYFNQPKEKFKCYIDKQLNPSHWNY